jgi:hypothetical protein
MGWLDYVFAGAPVTIGLCVIVALIAAEPLLLLYIPTFIAVSYLLGYLIAKVLG